MATPKETTLKALRRELSDVQDNLYRARMQVKRAASEDVRARYTEYAAEYVKQEQEALAAIAWAEGI